MVSSADVRVARRVLIECFWRVPRNMIMIDDLCGARSSQHLLCPSLWNGQTQPHTIINVVGSVGMRIITT